MPIDLSFCVRNKSLLSLSSNKGSMGSRGWGWPPPSPYTRIRFAWIRAEKQRQNSFCNCVDRTNGPNYAPPLPLICPHLLATLRLLQMQKLFHIAAKKEINYRSRSHSPVPVSRLTSFLQKRCHWGQKYSACKVSYWNAGKIKKKTEWEIKRNEAKANIYRSHTWYVCIRMGLTHNFGTNFIIWVRQPSGAYNGCTSCGVQ